jgi:hypothetical protein
MDLRTKPRWLRVLNVYRWVLFAPGRSAAAKVCTAFFVLKVVMAALELLLPGVGIEYLSRDHLYDVSGHVADGLVWFLALMFVRERDQTRAELSTYKAALQGAPLVVEAVNRRAEKARDAHH